MFINISGRLMLINASIIIKRRKNKQIRIESMAAFVFISGIHRTNGSDNEQLFGKSHSLFTAPKPSPSQGKAGMRGVACGTPPGPGMLRFVRPVPGSKYTMRRSSSWTMTCRLINFYNCMHSFQCGFEVVFTVNVHCLFYVFFYFFYLQLFYSLCVFDTSSYLICLYAYICFHFPLNIV